MREQFAKKMEHGHISSLNSCSEQGRKKFRRFNDEIDEKYNGKRKRRSREIWHSWHICISTIISSSRRKLSLSISSIIFPVKMQDFERELHVIHVYFTVIRLKFIVGKIYKEA